MEIISDFINAHPSFVYAVQILVAAFCIYMCLKKKKMFALKFAISSLVILLISLFLPDFFLIEVFYIPFYVIVNLIGVSAYFMIDMTAKKSFFVVVYIFLLQFMAECLTMTIRYGFGLDSTSVFWNLISVIIYFTVYSVMTFLFYKYAKEINLKNFKLALMMMLTFFFLFSLRNFTVYLLRTNNIISSIWSICNFMMASGAVLFLFIFFNVNKVDSDEIEKLELEAILAKEQQHYKQMMINIDVINRKSHDLKYQIKALGSLNDSEKSEQIKKLEKEVMIYDNFAKTGNIALDNTLSEKSLICEQNKIKFSYIADGSIISFLDVADIYVLFGNAIDNAIECVEKYDEDKRIISLIINKVGNTTKVHIENYCEDNINVSKIQTSKQDKENHGFGLKSIQFIVEKYHGFLSITKERQLFCVDIMFID